MFCYVRYDVVIGKVIRSIELLPYGIKVAALCMKEITLDPKQSKCTSARAIFMVLIQRNQLNLTLYVDLVGLFLAGFNISCFVKR